VNECLDVSCSGRFGAQLAQLGQQAGMLRDVDVGREGRHGSIVFVWLSVYVHSLCIYRSGISGAITFPGKKMGQSQGRKRKGRERRRRRRKKKKNTRIKKDLLGAVDRRWR
jgi:hypothetical protein